MSKSLYLFYFSYPYFAFKHIIYSVDTVLLMYIAALNLNDNTLIIKMIPNRLYHYCSIESFFHIVSSKSIWLCNSSQMNDSYENKWIEHYFDIIKEYFRDTKYENLIKDSFNMYEWNSIPPFIFCLSANKDLLSQWRAYSHDGQGVSIGFNSKSLNIKNELPSPNVYAHNTLGIEKVMYNSQSQKKKIVEVCKIVKEAFDNASSAEDKLLLSLDLAFPLVNWALIFKNPSFKEEREWRIIHTPASSYEESFDPLSELRFRLNSNLIMTYFSYNLKEIFNSDLIKEIVIGPKCKMKKKEIEQFLEHNNLGKTKVTISKSTYR